MPLLDLQRSVGALLVARAGGGTAWQGARATLCGLDLTGDERAWLEALAGSRGFKG
jgi:hypothetical protein